VVGGWAWLTSIRLVVIGRPQNNVGLLFGKMSATNVTNIFASQMFSDVDDKYTL